ncbi:cation transporter [Candidatus Woesearchaeota archaeon]|nr:cation transporter [Candidatus Woesearchaeota archaeon]
MEATFKIKGMHCKSCKALVEDVLLDIGVKIVSLTVDETKKEGTLKVNTILKPEELTKTLKEETGYVVTKI